MRTPVILVAETRFRRGFAVLLSEMKFHWTQPLPISLFTK